MPHPATSLGTTSIPNNSSSNNKAAHSSATLRRNLFHRSSIKNKRKQEFTVPNLSSPLFPLLSPTCATANRPRLSPLLHTVSDTELQQGPTSDYHGDTSIASYDIYNNFSDTSTNRNNALNLEIALAGSNNKKDISLLFENNKPELFETKHCLSSPNNSISPTIFNKSLLNRANDTVLYSSAETTTTLLHIESTEREAQDIKEFHSSFKSPSTRDNTDKFLLFECDRENLGADDSLLPLLPLTPEITPVGSPLTSPPPSPSRTTAELSVSVQQLLGDPSGGAEGRNPPFCESSEYYGDADADHRLDTPLIVDVLQEAEAAGNQPSTYLPELHSRGPMRHSAGSALSSSSYQAGSSTNRDRIFNPSSSYSTSSSYLRDRDLFGGGGSIYSYTGGRVPPTPPAHARPFSRSSSVPEQHYLQDFDSYDSLSKSSALNDYHTPFLGGTEKDPLSWQAALSSSSSKYGTSASSLIGGHYRRQQRLNRLGKQLSLSSDLPISDFSSSNYLNDGFGVTRDRKGTGLDSLGGASSSYSRGHLLRGHPLTSHSLHDAGTSLHSISGNSSIGKSSRTGLSSTNNSRLLNRSSPLTLGKSLQLVTENFGSAAYNKEESNRQQQQQRLVNKKTVRFNSEGSYNPLSAASSNVHNSSLSSSTLHPFSTTPGIFSINGTSSLDGTSNLLFGNHSNPLYGSSSYRYPHLSHKHSKSRLFDEFDICCDDDAWMTVEDVRSGRWARWDTQRQESQDSQTRDSGIETGSCFTSSEDSNRGGIVSAVGDHYLSKKV